MSSQGEAAIDAWARSGAMALTGRADGPALGHPEPLIASLAAVTDVIGARTRQLGVAVELDPLGTLCDRAAISDLHRAGTTSCGGGTRLLRTADGWLAISLVRPDDIGLVPAWLGLAGSHDTPLDPDGVEAIDTGERWAAIASVVRSLPSQTLLEPGLLLGLPMAALASPHPESAATSPAKSNPKLPIRARAFGDAAPVGALEGLVVVDLSSLWAGPLCGAVLAAAGAHVIKVESTRRPDGARLGPSAFFDHLNGTKRSVALDLSRPEGTAMLRQLLAQADVVIEASRPRALVQMGINAEELVAHGPRVWLSLTAHGRTGAGAGRVGFGDDSAVSGGLVVWEGDEPRFCVDAIADPATGMVAAAGVLDALASGGRWLLDVSLAGVAARLAGPTSAVPPGVEPADPIVPARRSPAPAQGADTDAVLAEFGLSR